MFRSRGCRQTRAWRRRSLGRRRKHGDGTTSDDCNGCRSRRRASLPVIHVCRRLSASPVERARGKGGACATRTLSTRQWTRAEIGTPRAPQQHPCAPPCPAGGLGATPIGRQGVAGPGTVSGPPLESAEWAVCDQQQQAGRLLGRAIPFFFFPRLVEEGSGISRLTDRVGGWDAAAGRRMADAHTDKRETDRARKAAGQAPGCLISRLFCVTNLPATTMTTNPAAEFAQKQFDFLVVGGGPAGLAVASRLSERADLLVGVLEAGLAAFGDDKVEVPGLAGTGLDTELDWKFRTLPQAGLGGRAIPWGRGKVLGGSSALNYMTWNRASRHDYDEWEKLGNAGWGWDGLLSVLFPPSFVPTSSLVGARVAEPSPGPFSRRARTSTRRVTPPKPRAAFLPRPMLGVSVEMVLSKCAIPSSTRRPTSSGTTP